MKDYFENIRQDIKNTVRFYQQEIDGEIKDENFVNSDIKEGLNIDTIQKSSIEEEEKLIRFKKFISHHREAVTQSGMLLYDILNNTFDAFFFVLIKRESAFDDRENLNKFGLVDGEVSQLRAMIHPAGISSIATKGFPAYLLLGLQKTMSRLAMGESMSFTRKNTRQDEFAHEDEEDIWKNFQPKRKKTDSAHFEYETNGMRTKSHWGDETIINQILNILSNEFDIEEDHIFFLGINIRTEEIVSFSKFNDFIMMPILQHFLSHFAQANAGSISQIISLNSLNTS
jgi:hypothetical protein